MHTVELLDEAVRVAQRLGYGIRHEWLGGSTGGGCEIAGKKWMFVDLALSPLEQLDQIAQSLKFDPQVHAIDMSAQLRGLMQVRKCA